MAHMSVTLLSQQSESQAFMASHASDAWRASCSRGSVTGTARAA